MNAEISKQVIIDLWLLRKAGEASQDSQALVSSYLAAHPDVAAELAVGDRLPPLPARQLSPEAEMRSLELAREKTRSKILLAAVGLLLATIVVVVALAGGLMLLVNRAGGL